MPCEYNCSNPAWCPACDATRKVDTSSRFAALASMASVREAYFHATGEWCTDAQALAACFSVPDGVGVTVAQLNVGVEMRELDAQDWVRQRDGIHAMTRMRNR